MDFLRTSAKLFDQGHRSEAKRLATVLRTLLHHRPHPRRPSMGSHALLSQLGVRDTWTWLDTAGEIDGNILTASFNLTFLSFTLPSGEATYSPVLGDFKTEHLWPPQILELMRQKGIQLPRRPGSFLDFPDWWQMAVIKDGGGHTFSREDLVLAVTNRDGGAHVDPGLLEEEHRLSRGNSLGWTVGEDDIPFPDNPMLATLRQIAFEVLSSVAIARPEPTATP